ncbi:MAG: Hsp20/alpha crystallin family protein [Deltaproteobacteria bacterium]|nr:Hsp20/alpha crystallin family protein [Deltaproteobacteria bacterium]
MPNDLREWRPFREVTRLRREMDRLWDDYFGPGRRGLQPLQAEFAPAVDVKESAEAVVVKAEVPGIDAQDINISVTGDVLTIKGEKKSEREEKEANYHLVERNYGSFSRALKLPAAVDLDKIEAKYDKGVLTVTCPKKEEVKPKAIEIKTA